MTMKLFILCRGKRHRLHRRKKHCPNCGARINRRRVHGEHGIIEDFELPTRRRQQKSA
jgi:rRNA maturation endonuclease Nob1